MSETTCSVRLTESTRVETFSDGVMAIVITILRERQYLPDVDPYRFELRGARRSADL